MPTELEPIAAMVLAAAKRVVATLGPDGLTMEELGRATGMSRTTLYRRTGGRDALLDALQQAGLPVGDRTDARSRILQAARVVFGRVGFAGATTEEIATEANVGVATIYRHFGDKEGLAATFLHELGPRRALREARFTGDLHADLEALGERMLAGLRDDGSLFRWILIEFLQGGPFLTRVRALSPTRSLTSISRLFATHIEQGTLHGADPQLLAQSFVGMVMAFGFMGPVFNNTPVPDPHSTARTIADLFLHGALAPRQGNAPHGNR